MTDTARAIQAAVVRADLLICRIRGSPWFIFLAALGVGLMTFALFHTNRRRQR